MRRHDTPRTARVVRRQRRKRSGNSLDPQAWGKGVGRLLHDTVLAGMTSCAVATVWVAEGNRRGRAFQERQGWRPDTATKPEELGGVEVVAMRYRPSLP